METKGNSRWNQYKRLSLFTFFLALSLTAHSVQLENFSCPIVYKGQIDNKYNITKTIFNGYVIIDEEHVTSGDAFSGIYVYDKYDTPIPTEGIRSGSNKIRLTEETGTFDLQIVDSGLEGTWTSNQGRTLPVFLSPIDIVIERTTEEGDEFQTVFSVRENTIIRALELWDSRIEIYSWGASDCMDNDLKGPSIHTERVAGHELKRVSWVIEYRHYGSTPSYKTVLIHPTGEGLELTTGSHGTRFGIYEYWVRNCIFDIADDQIIEECIREEMEPIRPAKEEHLLTQQKTTTLYEVTQSGFTAGEPVTVFRELQGESHPLSSNIKDIEWNSKP